MIRELKQIFTLTLTAAVLMLSSCVYDKDVAQDGNVNDVAGKGVQLTFTVVSGGETGSGTRAETWNSYTSTPADLYETRIDPGKLQVLVYDIDNKFAGKVSLLTYHRKDVDRNKHIYTFSGELSDASSVLMPDHYLNAKLVVLANCDKLADNQPAVGSDLSDLAQLDALKPDYTPSDFHTADGEARTDGSTPARPIPMFGVKTISNAYITPNVARLIDGDINMLRSLSKIRVTVADNTTPSGVKLYAATLDSYSPKVNVLPAGFAAAADTKDLETTTQGGSLSTFNPSASELVSKEIPFTRETDADGKPTGSWYVYVPEFDNSSSAATITVKAGTTETNAKSYELKLTNYANGTPDNTKPVSPVRNTLYTYRVTAIAPTLKVNYEVLPWDLVESEIGWNVDFTMYAKKGNTNDANKGDPEAVYCVVSKPRYLDDDHTSLVTDGGSSQSDFVIRVSGTKGAVWKAYLTNPEYFDFVDDEVSGTNQRLVSTGVVRDKEYYLSVCALKTWSADWETANYTYWRGTSTKVGDGWETSDDYTRGGPYTDLYVTISNDGGKTESLVPINPQIPGIKTPYKNNRRFAGEDDYHIRIWQLKARLPEEGGESDYGDLARANKENIYFK